MTSEPWMRRLSGSVASATARVYASSGAVHPLPQRITMPSCLCVALPRSQVALGTMIPLIKSIIACLSPQI